MRYPKKSPLSFRLGAIFSLGDGVVDIFKGSCFTLSPSHAFYDSTTRIDFLEGEIEKQAMNLRLQ
jgi:hypothetical protein